MSANHLSRHKAAQGCPKTSCVAVLDWLAWYGPSATSTAGGKTIRVATAFTFYAPSSALGSPTRLIAASTFGGDHVNQADLHVVSFVSRRFRADPAWSSPLSLVQQLRQLPFR